MTTTEAAWDPNATDGELVIRRLVNASRARVWMAWTDVTALQRWFGPKGTTLPTCTLDLRPSGLFLYCMRSPEGDEHWGRWFIRTIAEPSRLEFVVSFSDPSGGIVRAPFSDEWPREMLSVVTFEDRGDSTLMTLRSSSINANEIERRTFRDGHASMREGWGGTFDQLDAYLAET